MDAQKCSELRGIVNHIGGLLREFPAKEMMEEAELQSGILVSYLKNLAGSMDQAMVRLGDIEKVLAEEIKKIRD